MSDPAHAQTQKTDGADGPPVLPPPPASTGANSALKEAPPTPGEGYARNHPAAAHLVVVDPDRAVVAYPEGVPHRRKIAISGFASSSRHLIPVNDPTWEVWGMNQLYRHIPRADRWFDIHWNWDKETVPGTDYRGWLQTCGIPFYMMARSPEIPTAVRYPIERLIGNFCDYYTSTVAFMAALAIEEIDQRVEAELLAGTYATPADVLRRQRELYNSYLIGFFGIDLVVDEEYFEQKACAEFWIGAAAMGRGIEVYIPPQSALCKQRYRYGYEPEPTSLVRLSEIRAHIKEVQAEREQALRHAYMADGALQADEHWMRALELRLRGAEVRL